MKNKKLLFLFILLFHLVVLNDTNNLLFNFEFLMQGSLIYPGEETPQFILYHYVLNLGLIILFLSTVLQVVSETFEMRDYIITRCGCLKFKLILLEAALKNIFIILIIKQIIYIMFFIYTKSFTMFYFYDMVSTFLTLLMFAQCFSLFKLNGAKDKIPLFLIVGINMISQILSYEHPVFSVIVIASTDWKLNYLTNIAGKIIIILVLVSMIFLHKNLDKTLGEKDV